MWHHAARAISQPVTHMLDVFSMARLFFKVWERKFQGTKVLGTFAPQERSSMGAKVPFVDLVLPETTVIRTKSTDTNSPPPGSRPKKCR